MSRIKSLLFLLVLAAQVPLASAAVTYAVGSCKPGLSSFPTIMRALEAIPAPNVVQVCPGTYAEQVVITNPVTLEGISASNSATGPTITAPTGGLVANAADDFGAALAVQIWIENAPGEVNLTNLTVDGINNNVGNEAPYNVGVFYQNSPGTANRLFVVNQSGNLRGYGIWLEGGSANPSVTVENSLVANFDWVGIYAETNSSTSELSATIKANNLSRSVESVPTTGVTTGIELFSGLTASVSDNAISSGFNFPGIGIVVEGGQSTISGNSIDHMSPGIDIETDGVSVTSNKISNIFSPALNNSGINLNSAVAPVTHNTISQMGFAITTRGSCAAGSNLQFNTIVGVSTGLSGFSTAAAKTNSFKSVKTIVASGC